MANLESSTETEFLMELQRRFDSGVIAGKMADKDENLYYWWGDRVAALGFCNRLGYGVNEEMSNGLEEEDSSDSDTDVDENEISFGNYL